MELTRLKIHLLPAPDDAALNSREYQAELDAFDKTLRSYGIAPQRVRESLECAAGPSAGGTWLSQFVIVAKELKPIIPHVCTAIAVYFAAKWRRGVTFEIGKGGRIKGSAQTFEDAEKLLERLVTESRKQLPQKAAKEKSGNKKPNGKTRA
jgi:hypothetical protein